LDDYTEMKIKSIIIEQNESNNNYQDSS